MAAPEGEDEDRAAELKSFVEGMIREKAENTEAQKPEGAKESKKRDEKLPQPISAMPGPRAGKRKVQGVAHQGYAGAEQPVLSEPKASNGGSMQKKRKPSRRPSCDLRSAQRFSYAASRPGLTRNRFMAM